MAYLTTDHIDYITKDITYRGVVVEGIREELIDHICDGVESEMAMELGSSTLITKFFTPSATTQASEMFKKIFCSQKIKLPDL